ncbi:hypothetical protein NFI96_002170, partial [Prochilodus magdalenae]
EAATYSTTTDLEEYTSSVTSYIGKCIDDVTVSKTITTRPNHSRGNDCRSACSAEGSGSRLRLQRRRQGGPKESKGQNCPGASERRSAAHGQSIHSHFRDSGDARRMWQGIQAITNY